MPLPEKPCWPKKHVYVEKPLVLDESEALELIDLAERQNRTLMVGPPVTVSSGIHQIKRTGILGRIGENQLYLFSPSQFRENQA